MLFRIGIGLSLAAAAFAGGSLSVTDAVRRSDAAALKTALAAKADVNAAGIDGTTPLHWAVENDDLAALNLLIAAGANVKAKDRYGFTPLYNAGTNGNAPIVKRLLAAGADPNDVGQAGDTVLMATARNGNLEALDALIAKGAAVNAKDTDAQQTALMWAVRSNHPEAVKLLLERGADVASATRKGRTPAVRPPGAGGGSHGVGIVRSGWPERGYRGETPGGMTALLYAARDGRAEIARQLTAAKADVNQAEADGITPLLVAVTNAHLDVAQHLLMQGADPKAVDWWGRSPLWSAVEIRNRDVGRSGELDVDRAASLEVIQSLLARNVDVNVRTKEVPPTRRFVNPLGDLSWVDFTGMTPFLRAALSGDVTVMRMLLAKGADPNIPTNSNTTALMAAAGVNWVVGQTYTESKESTMEALKLCLEKGGDVNAKNSMGLTAVMGAANRGADNILEFLVSKGAKLDVKDNEGRTPTVWAEGVFLATNAPERKPSTIALIEKLSGASK